MTLDNDFDEIGDGGSGNASKVFVEMLQSAFERLVIDTDNEKEVFETLLHIGTEALTVSKAIYEDDQTGLHVEPFPGKEEGINLCAVLDLAEELVEAMARTDPDFDGAPDGAIRHFERHVLMAFGVGYAIFHKLGNKLSG